MKHGMTHPNRLAFRGVLFVAGFPSDGVPEGALGHRILIQKATALKALPSLIGMGLNVAPNLDAHARQNKIGVFTRVSLCGDAVVVAGHIFGRDFPEYAKRLRGDGFGLSFEAVDAYPRNRRSEIWELTELTFTGAAVLKRENSAYRMSRFQLGAK